jgi:hypothetical protein
MRRLENVEGDLLKQLDTAKQTDLAAALHHAGDDGVTMINRLNGADIRKLLGSIDGEGISPSQLGEFLSTPNNHRLVADVTGGSDLIHVVRMSPGERASMRAFAYRGPELRHVDGDLSADELARLSRSSNDFSFRKTEVLAKSPNGKVLWMDHSDIDHAIQRHIYGQNMLDKETTTFLPAGQTIDRPGIPEKTMPPRMPDQPSVLREEIRDAAYQAIRDPDITHGNKIVYRGYNEYGIKEITLIQKGNRVQSVFPTGGNNIWQ